MQREHFASTSLPTSTTLSTTLGSIVSAISNQTSGNKKAPKMRARELRTKWPLKEEGLWRNFEMVAA
ncbi:MAG: hypothetical protein IKC51_07915 [Myxococcaceae bacterium]|nr:hypothetical protein [Myxococcaceae bacterium]